jgi:hypothetical protein
MVSDNLLSNSHQVYSCAHCHIYCQKCCCGDSSARSLIWDWIGLDWIANPKPLLKEDSPNQQTIKADKTPSFSLVHKLVSSI